jgi:hypothetical protein
MKDYPIEVKLLTEMTDGKITSEKLRISENLPVDLPYCENSMSISVNQLPELLKQLQMYKN